MYKIGVIGDFENAAVFSMVGADVRCPEAPDEAEKILKELIKDGYGVVFVSDKYVQNIKHRNFPVIIPLPIDADLRVGRRKTEEQLKKAAGLEIV